jgi:predicted MFS family arabinose efflux permease
VGFAAASVPADGIGASARITWFSIAVYVGLLLGAPLGEAVLTRLGFLAVWLLAAIAAIAAAGCGLALPPRVQTTKPDGGKPPLVHPAGLLPGVAYGASVWGYTAFNTFIPLYVAQLGTHNTQSEYLVYGVVLLGVRVLGQRLIGRLRPHRVGIAALVFTAIGLAGLASWQSPPGLICGTVLLAVGQALGLPAFLTVAVDAVPAGQRGSVLATVTGFFDVGFLTSALGIGAVNQLAGLRYGFTVAAAMSATAVLLFVPWRRMVPPPTVQADPLVRSDDDRTATGLSRYPGGRPDRLRRRRSRHRRPSPRRRPGGDQRRDRARAAGPRARRRRVRPRRQVCGHLVF